MGDEFQLILFAPKQLQNKWLVLAERDGGCVCCYDKIPEKNKLKGIKIYFGS
jgi:hypothetical protein